VGGKAGLLGGPKTPYNLGLTAGVAQLVERNLAKVEVASSRLVSRSSRFAGGMAEWLCSGLQSRLPRFDSGSRLHRPWFTVLGTGT
jgi:hypothetical protein